ARPLARRPGRGARGAPARRLPEALLVPRLWQPLDAPPLLDRGGRLLRPRLLPVLHRRVPDEHPLRDGEERELPRPRPRRRARLVVDRGGRSPGPGTRRMGDRDPASSPRALLLIG